MSGKKCKLNFNMSEYFKHGMLIMSIINCDIKNVIKYLNYKRDMTIYQSSFININFDILHLIFNNPKKELEGDLIDLFTSKEENIYLFFNISCQFDDEFIIELFKKVINNSYLYVPYSIIRGIYEVDLNYFNKYKDILALESLINLNLDLFDLFDSDVEITKVEINKMKQKADMYSMHKELNEIMNIIQF